MPNSSVSTRKSRDGSNTRSGRADEPVVSVEVRHVVRRQQDGVVARSVQRAQRRVDDAGLGQDDAAFGLEVADDELAPLELDRRRLRLADHGHAERHSKEYGEKRSRHGGHMMARTMVREINQAGLDLIKSFEGLEDGNPATVNLDPYLDPIGIWTIGWGHAIWVGNDFLRGATNKGRAAALYPNGITRPQAEALLHADLLDTCRDVQNVVSRPITDHQFAALVSFAYNCGAANLRKSTLLRLVNAGDFEGADGEFVKWNKAGGRSFPV